jgi:hypothetical protein
MKQLTYSRTDIALGLSDLGKLAGFPAEDKKPPSTPGLQEGFVTDSRDKEIYMRAEARQLGRLNCSEGLKGRFLVLVVPVRTGVVREESGCCVSPSDLHIEQAVASMLEFQGFTTPSRGEPISALLRIGADPTTPQCGGGNNHIRDDGRPIHGNQSDTRGGHHAR